MRKTFGWIIFLLGSWMLVSPQALLGLKQLKWMYNYAFPGEVLLGVIVSSVGLYLLDIKLSSEDVKTGGH
jgi:hypothetical protein